MIFFIKRKCFDDVRGVRGFGLVLLDYSYPPISSTHLEFSLVMLKESMNPQQIVHRIKVHNARAWQVFMKVVKVALNTCAFERNLLELYDIQLYNKKLNLKAINLEWYIHSSRMEWYSLLLMKSTITNANAPQWTRIEYRNNWATKKGKYSINRFRRSQFEMRL